MFKEGLFVISLPILLLSACQPGTHTNQSPSAQETEMDSPKLSFIQFLQTLPQSNENTSENWQAIATYFLPDSTVRADRSLRTQQIPFPPPFQLLFYEYLGDQPNQSDMYLSVFDSSGQVLDLLELRRVSFDGNVTINVIDGKILEIEYYDFYRPGNHDIKDVYTDHLAAKFPRSIPTNGQVPGLQEIYDYENYRISSAGKLHKLSRRDSVNLERKFPFTSTRILSKDEIKRYSSTDLRQMINEIYASHGYIFRDKETLEHFSKYPWYRPSHQSVERLLTDVESVNIQTLSQLE